MIFCSPDKYIETSEHGLLIIAANEADAGRYDCWLGGSLLCSYNITVDSHRYNIDSSNCFLTIYYNINIIFFIDVLHLKRATNIRKYIRIGVTNSKSINRQ